MRTGGPLLTLSRQRYTGVVRPHLVALAIVLASCGAGSTLPSPPVSSAAAVSAIPTATALPTPAPTLRPIAAVLEGIDPAKLNDHMVALASFGSRDLRNPQPATPVAYLKDAPGAIPGV